MTFSSAAASSLGVRRNRSASQQLAVGHHQTIGERELRVDQLVAERHVAQLVREHRREARFVGQHVDEAAAQHDRVADRERLERRGQQDPGAQRPLKVQLVGDDEVVEDGLEDLVRFARRREQADCLESFEDVRLGLLFPSALAEHGRQLRGPFGGVGDIGLVDPDRRQRVGPVGVLSLVSPDPCLALEPGLPLRVRGRLGGRLRRAVQIGFFRVDVRRHPHAGRDVHTPAVHMERQPPLEQA